MTPRRTAPAVGAGWENQGMTDPDRDDDDYDAPLDDDEQDDDD